MISGQSDCGIFPLLFDFSITKDLGSTFTFLPALGPWADTTDSEPVSPEGSDRRKRDGNESQVEISPMTRRRHQACRLLTKH
jgi:hypothetical protein